MSDNIKDGGPAFPSLGEGHGNPAYHSPGMSLRDWFAGQALAGLMAGIDKFKEMDVAEAAASFSYLVADAMLKAREVMPLPVPPVEE